MIFFKQRLGAQNLGSEGFSILEVLIAMVILPIVVISLSSGYNAVRHSYTIARQLNEMYAVLSACPELDRAHDFGSLSSSNNCYPNNSFAAENNGSGTISYTPVLTVTDTTALPGSDPLSSVFDSKVISITVNYPAPITNRPPLQLRMLITRNGIGQQ